MSKLINYNSIEGKVLKEFFQENMIDPYIALIVESYIYKEVIEYYEDTGARTSLRDSEQLRCDYPATETDGLRPSERSDDNPAPGLPDIAGNLVFKIKIIVSADLKSPSSSITTKLDFEFSFERNSI